MKFPWKTKTQCPVVHSYTDACKLMKKMGMSVKPAKSGRGSIISKDGLNWNFNGDSEGLVISRAIAAPARWSEDALVAWMYQKNFAVAIYDETKNQFVIATHILLKGGVVIQTITRLANNFDSSIRSFTTAMEIDVSKLDTLD